MRHGDLRWFAVVCVGAALCACEDSGSEVGTTAPGGSGGMAVGGAAGSSPGGSGGSGGQGVAGGGAGGSGGSAGAECTGFFDPLIGSALPIANVDGGEFSSDGWTVTANKQWIRWPGQRIASEAQLEFEVRGLGPDQQCGNNNQPSLAGRCRLWWFASNETGTPNTSEWSGTGRRIAPNYQCVGPCEPNPLEWYIDRVRMHGTAAWINYNKEFSDKLEWVAATWYHMVVTWDCKGLYWKRGVVGGADPVQIVEHVYKPGDPAAESCYAPENDDPPGDQMIFEVGGNMFGSIGATFRNVRYTPIVCSDVLPAAD